MLAILAIKDPLKPQVKEAINQCQQAHITVRIITGDSLDTAIAVAKEAGVIPSSFTLTSTTSELKTKSSSSRYRCMTGADFRRLVGGLREEVIGGEKKEVINNVHAFRDIMKELRVLARSTPYDKYLLVTGLKNEGNVVAVTGDHLDDVPALEKANVGLSMGKIGSEIAKEASDIIIMDDNFGSIVTSIKWGRNIFDSLRKFL